MRVAVIVCVARTGIGRAYKGSFQQYDCPALGAHALRTACNRAAIDLQEVDDVIMGCALQQGSSGFNIARQCAIRAGLPTSVAAMSVDRQCSSGLMAVAIAAQQIVVDGMKVTVAGGVESISLVQNSHLNTFRARDPWIGEHRPDLYMSMLETAEVVAGRYAISRERQDEYAVQSQQRNAAACKRRIFDAEIVPFATTMAIAEKDSGSLREQPVLLDHDEGARPQTNPESLRSLRTAFVPDAHSAITHPTRHRRELESAFPTALRLW